MYYLLNIAKWVRKIWLYKILKRHTHGVRVILRDNEKILLIKHPYDNFWVFPGGMIEKDEQTETAARREIQEETPYVISGDIKLFGHYTNNTGGKNDSVTVYIAEKYKPQDEKKRKESQHLIDKIEIQKCQWFNLNQLPTISAATQKRVNELLRHEISSISREWA